MPLVQIDQPAVEPVSLAEAKSHCNVDSDITEDDAKLGIYIKAARRYAEGYCGRSFITQTWRLVLDAFPAPSVFGVPFGVPYSRPGNVIDLERGRVQQVLSVKYQDMTGAWQTMSPSLYVADLDSPLARLAPVFGQIWPTPTLPQIGAVRIDFKAGYGDAAADVPDDIRHWIMMRVASMYAAREDTVQLTRGSIQSIPFVDGLLDPYRILVA